MPSSPGFRPTHATHANAKAATRKMRMTGHFAAAAAAKPSHAATNKYANSLEESLNRVRKMKSSYSMHAGPRLPHVSMAGITAATKAAAKATANAAVKAAVHATMKIQQKPPTIGYRTQMSAANITRRVSPKVEKAAETIMDRLVKKLDVDVGKKKHGGRMTMRNRSKRNKTRKLY